MAAVRAVRRGQEASRRPPENCDKRLFAEDLVDALGRSTDGRSGNQRVRCREQLEVLFGMGQCIVRHQCGNVRQFGGLGAQKLAARGSIEKKIGDRDGGSAGQGGVFDVKYLAAGNFHARSGGFFTG